MDTELKLPQVGDEQITLLERLSNACAVSGDEGEVRGIVLEQGRPLVDELKVDALGNVLATRHGRGEHPLRVMLAAHMDEVGLMLIHDSGEGIYRFDTVGSVAASDLPAKVVWVGRQHIPGVIGMRPPHLGSPAERSRPVAANDLHLDVGLSSGKVKVGDRAVFATRFSQVGPSLRGKALDDRLGVATLIELLRHAPPQLELLAAFTVQEEVGLRGARVAAFAFDPQLAIVLDTTPAYDLPAWDGSENLRYNARLDEGPAIYIADAGTLSDPRLVRFLMQTAETYQIPYQLRQPGGGGTDAGAVHKQLQGIPSVSISVPGRYLHSPASIARRSDWQHTLELAAAALWNLTPEVLAGER